MHPIIPRIIERFNKVNPTIKYNDKFYLEEPELNVLPGIPFEKILPDSTNKCN